MSHKEFLKAYAREMEVSEATAAEYIQGMMNVLYPEFQKGESVTIQHLGRFYCRHSRSSGQKVFKFTPAQKLKAILGWSSSYKGKL